uniref:Solute carrier organic anion transporter family member n=1 Tax=Meleagris gallopavo TaxID=9103 RepID=G1NQW7_MELGA
MTSTATKSSCPDRSQKALCRNPFLSIKFFVFCHGLLQLSQLLVSSYLKSSISTIEKRYGLSSKTSGLLASFNEVGNTLLIVFISYFGSRVHRPRFIGCGAILVSLAGFLMSLPHFITGPYEYDQSVASVFSNTTDLCQPEGMGSSGNLSDSICAPHTARENHEVLLVMFIAQVLLGIGGVPIQPFGISYIDDFASERNSPLYLGILFSLTVVGPGVGFMLGSGMLRFYVDIDKVAGDEVLLTNKDPRWVGAWWLGFLVAASLVAVSAVPYFFFPREMPKEVTSGKEISSKKSKDVLRQLKSRSENVQNLSLLQFIKYFPVVLLRNLRHPVYLLVVLAQVNLSAMVAGLATFMGKFLERQFSLTASFANMIIGSVNIPGAMVGIVVGGAILKRFQMSLKQCSAMCVLGMLLCLILAFPSSSLAAPHRRLPASPTERALSLDTTPQSAASNVTAPRKPTTPSVALMASSTSLPVTPAAVLSVLPTTQSWSIQPEDKSFAVGIQFMLLRVLAWMPGPVLYGSAIDTTCILWENKCDRKASCRYYDNNLFRQRYLGLQFFFEVGAFLCFVMVYVILRRQEKDASNVAETTTDPEKKKLAENTRKSPESNV